MTNKTFSTIFMSFTMPETIHHSYHRGGQHLRQAQRQPDTVRPQDFGQEKKRGYQEDEAAQEGKRRGRLHLFHTLVITNNGNVSVQEP